MIQISHKKAEGEVLVKKFTILFIVLILFLLNSNTSAFDGNRKGFVLGGGGGYSRVFETDNTRGILSLNLSIGYGFSDKNILLLDKAIRYYRFINAYGWSQMDTFRIYQYFSDTKKSFFTSLGYSYAGANRFTVGGGYANSKNWQIGLFFYDSFKHSNNSELSLIFSYTAF